jgi:hypothetical protein
MGSIQDIREYAIANTFFVMAKRGEPQPSVRLFLTRVLHAQLSDRKLIALFGKCRHYLEFQPIQKSRVKI